MRFSSISGCNVKQNNILENLPQGALPFCLAELVEKSPSPVMYIARDDKRLARAKENIQNLSKQIEIIEIPAWDCLPYDRVSPSGHVLSRRLDSFTNLLSSFSKNSIILTTISATLTRTIPTEIVQEFSLTIKVGSELTRDKLIKRLISLSYNRSATANEAGEFAIRGSIIDIIPVGTEQGFRIDFDGDMVEVIRIFDPLTQISSTKQDSVKIALASEVVLTDDTIAKFRNKYRQLFGNVISDDPLYDLISQGRKYAGMEHWLALFYDELSTIFDYIPEDTTIICDYLCEQAKEERLETINDCYNSRVITKSSELRLEDSYRATKPSLLYLSEQEYKQELAKYKVIHLSNNVDAVPANINVLSLNCQPVPEFHVLSKANKKNSFDLLRDYLKPKILENKDTKIVVCCISQGSRDRMRNILEESDFKTTYIEDWDKTPKIKAGYVGLYILNIEKGFSDANIIAVSEQDILGERLSSSRKSRKKSDNFLLESSSLAQGELVVHRDHGLGRFEALETINVAGKDHDCLRLIYQNGDKLYLPVENIDLLTRYGANQEEAVLDKLGHSSWQARKAKSKKRLKMMAEELLKIAAQRQLHQATKFDMPAGLYDEFCAKFPYIETDDQLKAIHEVEQDMASGRPMDRLVCGDVGFGKTEIALRAAFIAVSADQPKQVAVIAPTTLLCRQHYQTFAKRFAGFPFIVRDLSRLTPPKQAKHTKEELASGRVDIVIGTHSLLAKSLKIKNLGLVVIDEEQLFGVKQKERFKDFKNSVHMLTLSATPIPRTLQMSLAGIRELSIIATAPIDRLAIRSFTMPFDNVVIRNAILREHYRSGQTFFVAPRISDLDEIEQKLKDLVPEVKAIKAHGGLAPKDLDTTMNDFYDGKYDVLISTNIIGSGIDLPNANTIVIYRSDLFGLAQLYQMRGRVGRGKTRAYAYFTIPAKRIPSKIALRRLEVIQNLDSLGAGFSLASHDMDIRGFGNLLGEEQSGNVKEVGVELYQEMLKEAIENAKVASLGGEIQEKLSPHINLGIPVLIPEDFVEDIELRLGLYRRLAQANDEDEIEMIAIEMADRFGNIPPEVENLFEIMKIKIKCIRAGIEKIDAGDKGIVITFQNGKFANPEALISYIAKNPLKTKIRPDQKIVIKQIWPDEKSKINGTKKYLNEIMQLVA